MLTAEVDRFARNRYRQPLEALDSRRGQDAGVYWLELPARPYPLRGPHMRLLAIVLGCVCLERGSVGMAGQPSALLIVLGLALVLRGLYPHAGRR